MSTSDKETTQEKEKIEKEEEEVKEKKEEKVQKQVDEKEAVEIEKQEKKTTLLRNLISYLKERNLGIQDILTRYSTIEHTKEEVQENIQVHAVAPVKVTTKT